MWARSSLNQMLPSGASVCVSPDALTSGIGNAVITPAVVIRSIVEPLANQRLPSDPTARPFGLLESGRGNSVMTPSGVMHPTAFLV